MNIILYSSEVCPKCNILKTKLNTKNIPYESIEGEEAARLGIDFVPVLEVDGKRLEFAEANKWVNEQEAR